MRRAAAALVAALALTGAPAALATDCPRTSLGDVEDEVMCPVCGTPLALATEAPQAQRQRELIERLIDRCATKGEVKRALVAEFGEEVLALPGDEEDDDLGDVLAYAVPALLLLLGGGAVAVAAVRWRRPRRAVPSSGGSAELDEDIERYDL